MRPNARALLVSAGVLAAVFVLQRFSGDGPAPRSVAALALAVAVALAAAFAVSAALIVLLQVPCRLVARRRPPGGLGVEPATTFAAGYLVATGLFRAALGPPIDPLLFASGGVAAALAGHVIGAAAAGARSPRYDRPGSGGPVRMRAGGLLLGLLAALPTAFLLSGSASRAAVEDGVRLQAEGSGQRLVCVLVDGVLPRELERLAAPFGAGDLARFEQGGSWLPPTFWRTIVTGHPPREHGVRGALCRAGMVRRDPAYAGTVADPWADAWEALGAFAPVPGVGPARPLAAVPKPVWRVASEAGRTAGVLGVWFTWPAPRVRRFSLSDAAFVVLDSGERGSGEERLPSGLLWPEDDARWSSAVARLARAAPSPPGARSGSSVDRFVVEATRISLELFRPHPDLLVVGLRGPDSLGPGSSREDVLHAVADRLAELHALFAPGGATVLILGHPGVSRRGEPAALWVNRAGAFAASSSPLSPYDLAPTVMHALGVPLSRELRGKVRSELLAPSGRDPRRLRVASYGRMAWRAPLLGSGSGAHRAPDLPYLTR